MNVSAPTAVATKPFQLLYTRNDAGSASRAVAQVTRTAAAHGVTASDVAAGPALLESLPPKGYVTGSVTGPIAAVTEALKGLELLELG